MAILYLAAIYLAFIVLLPIVWNIIVPFVNADLLNSYFNFFTSGTWYFWGFFALDTGLPLIISASIARFLVRRIPVVG